MTVQIDERLPTLVRMVKAWGGARGLNDASNGTFNSYALTLLVRTKCYRIKPLSSLSAYQSTCPRDRLLALFTHGRLQCLGAWLMCTLPIAAMLQILLCLCRLWGTCRRRRRRCCRQSAACLAGLCAGRTQSGRCTPAVSPTAACWRCAPLMHYIRVQR